MEGWNKSQRQGQEGSELPSEQAEPNVKEEDKRSVFVENVDYKATKEEIENVFCDCGKVLRVTILRDKFSNTPRGLAYVQFDTTDAVQHAIYLTGAQIRGRMIRVSPKRTNIKGLAKPKKKNPMDNPGNLLQGLLGMFGTSRFKK